MTEATFTLTGDILVSAQRLNTLIRYFQRSAWKQWGVGGLVSILLAALHSCISTDTWDQMLQQFPLYTLVYALVAVAVYLLVAAFVYFVLGRLVARFHMRAQRPPHRAFTAHWDAQGWHVRNPTSDTAWGSYGQWAENDKLLLLYTNARDAKARMFQIVPKHIFTSPDDLDRIRAWLTQAGVPRVAPFR